MVLLTIPGKAAGRVPSAAVKSEKADFKFEKIVRQIKASASGLVDVIPEGDCGSNFCGTRRYAAAVDADGAEKVKLQLPNALRAMCRVLVNGVESGERVWPPYCWDLELVPGVNRIELDISGTPDAAVTAPEHQAYLHENKFDNVYWQRCMQFEKLFPEEDPLKDAVIIR